MVRPLLHHFATLCQSLGAIVGGSDLIALCMRELKFDQVRMPALLGEAMMIADALGVPRDVAARRILGWHG